MLESPDFCFFGSRVYLHFCYDFAISNSKNHSLIRIIKKDVKNVLNIKTKFEKKFYTIFVISEKVVLTKTLYLQRSKDDEPIKG